MGGVYTRADRKSDLAQLYNRIVDRDAGNAAAPGLQVTWTQFDGSVPSVNGSTARTNQATHLIRNTGGHHARILLAATDPSATLTAANCVWLVDDAFVGVGVGVPLRLYGPGGTSYGSVTGDDNGAVTLSGSGTNAGVFAVVRLLATTSVEVGAANVATTGAVRLANTGAVTERNAAHSADITLLAADASNNVLLGDIVNAPSAYVQALTDVRLKVSTAELVKLTSTLLAIASGVSLTLGATPALSGAIRLTNTTGMFTRNAANNADVSVAVVDSSNNVLLGDGANSATAYLRALTTVNLRIGVVDEVAVTASLVTINPDIALPGAVWTPFTPTATQSVTISPTVNLARYRIFGKLAIVQIKVTAGAVGTAANAIEIGTIPAAIAPKTTGASVPSGTFQVLPGGGAAIRMGLAVFNSSTAVRGLIDNNANFLGATPAYTIAVNDTVSCQLVYELA